MNSFPVVISYLTRFYCENRCLQISAKLVLRPFRAQHKNFLVCIKFNKGGNSLPKHFERNANIRSNL